MNPSVLALHLRPGDHVVVGQATGEPPGLVGELFALAAELGPLNVFCGFSPNPAWGGPIDAALRVTTYCGLGSVRHVVGRGARGSGAVVATGALLRQRRAQGRRRAAAGFAD